jgi:hypothetical protein
MMLLIVGGVGVGDADGDGVGVGLGPGFALVTPPHPIAASIAMLKHNKPMVRLNLPPQT